MYNEQLYIDVEIGVLYMAAVRSVKGYLVTQLAPRDPLSVCQHTPIPGHGSSKTRQYRSRMPRQTVKATV